MLYSLTFVGFILVLLLVYYLMPKKYRWTVLLLGSYVFLAAKSKLYIAFIIFATIFTFFIAKKIETLRKWKPEGDITPEEKKALKAKNKKSRQLLVTVVIVILGALLAVFKFKPVTTRFDLILPLGMSYYTFQVIGYIIDIYRGEYEAEKNIFHYALFVGYFPGMIQGPINRFGQMRDQFFGEKKFEITNLRDGAWLYLWGLFKKLVIADRCAIFVNTVMSDQLAELPGSMAVMGVIMFVVQMYGDFSGGIDMVEGISEMFGIKMYQNFRQPFFSTTIGEFWRRWHISLGNWIRDYCFYPMAFSKPYRNLSNKIKPKSEHLAETVPGLVVSVITFVILGLWHEISLRYLLYGLWYGFAIGMGNVCAPIAKKIADFLEIRTDCMSHRAFCRLRTMLIVLVGESLCIVPALSCYKIIAKAIIKDFQYYQIFFKMFELGLTRLDFLCLFVALLIWLVVSILHEQGHSLRKEIAAQNGWFRIMLTIGIIVTISIYGIYGPGFDATAFIYAGI